MYEFNEEEQEVTSEEENADDVLEEIEESSEDDGQGSEAVAVMNKAMQRIEEANLWKLLIGHSFFSPQSAKPEIIQSVNKKIRNFATKELEVLLGMRNRDSAPAPTASVQQFSPEEAHVLRMLISKVLKKDVVAVATAAAEKKPELMQLSPEPTQQTMQKPIQAKQGAQAQTPKKKRGKNIVSATPNAKTKVKAMPSADQLLQGGVFVQPQMALTAEPGISSNDAARGANLLGNLVRSLTGGGSSVAVDNRPPSDSVQDSGGDTNERF